MMQKLRPFHLAIPVYNIEATRHFYVDMLGCVVGRETDRWIDFDFYGHQVSAHLVSETIAQTPTNPVDDKPIPIRHFGLVLDWQEWHKFIDKLKTQSVDFIIEPTIRFKDQIGEQATMFIRDPSSNTLEFKAFKDESMLFRS